MRPVDVRPTRPSTQRAVTAVLAGLAAILSMISITAKPRTALATSCVISPKDGTMPPHVREWARELTARRPANPGGFEALAQGARENREAVREGA